MDGRQGVFHKTTLDAVASQQQRRLQATTTVGLKRPYSGATNKPHQYTESKKQLQIQRASTLAREPTRLTASDIIALDAAAAAADAGPSEYSQRKVISATPSAVVDRSLSLSFSRYALPEPLIQNLNALGINEIYPWQKQCLLGPGLLNGTRNLVYSAPTGGGKSLVADILMLKRILEDRNAKALLILPYVALVQEKVRWLRHVVQDIKKLPPKPDERDGRPQFWQRRMDEDSVRVAGLFGGGKIKATWSDFDIGVCTFEKANMLINGAIDDCSISNLKAVVLDELHMVDDDHRGYLMELIATKLLSLEHNVQIIGMSATLANIEVLSTWLNAHMYKTFYRPIPVEEHLVYEGQVYPASSTRSILKTASQLRKPSASQALDLGSQPVRAVQPSQHKQLQDPVLNAVVSLASETARSGYGVLVFCSSRQGCESDARIISRVLPQANELPATILEKRSDLLEDLRSLTTGLDPTLAETIPAGVAFHHAGMTTEERDLISLAYDSGAIKVVVATCSLAAGINLPARRVILHNARMGRDLIGPSMLRQMRGRAGRKGKDEIGETYLCCRKDDLDDVVELMHADLPQVSSALTTDKRRIQRALLEVVSIRLVDSRESMNEYIGKTLLSISREPELIREHVDSSLQELLKTGFIQCDRFDTFVATQFGKAVVASSLDPEDGAFIHREMQRALRAFVMDGEMHVLYTFTPVQELSMTINWQVFRSEMEALDDSGLRVMTFLGLKPTIVNRMAQGGTLKESTPEEKETARVYRRFYLALQLRDLCNEIPVHVVARKYDMPRGTVQTLQQTCQGFAAGMIKFCEQMGWGAMAATLDHFSDRLKAGAKADLLALAKVTFIKSRTARVFYDNGFKTVALLANADPKELIPILMQAQPSKLRTKSGDGKKYEERLLAKAQIITDSANRIWQAEMQHDLSEE
ncbi:P-loop containing nucleoside triphosphate hydrolase protein [Xylaria sp. CBS 124048]|nr:P-loop containing nucleoside triphosphate hydrolase protein [Xylaria sp. CBS 124048]